VQTNLLYHLSGHSLSSLGYVKEGGGRGGGHRRGG